jgi:hypothetical protein
MDTFGRRLLTVSLRGRHRSGDCKQDRVGRLDGVLDRLANLSAAGLSPGQPPAKYSSTNLGTFYLLHASTVSDIASMPV